MTKGQDLRLQRRSRPEQSDQRQRNQAANISHQPRTSPNSTSLASRIEFPTMTGGSAVRDQHSGARFLPCQARRDPNARYLRQRDSRNGLSRLGLGRASFVTFDPSLTYDPHEACRRTKNLQRELKHSAIFPKRYAVFVVTS